MDMERRHGVGASIAYSHGGAQRGPIGQVRDRDLQNPGHFAVGRRHGRMFTPHGDDRVQAETAHGDVDRRQRPENADAVGRQGDFLIRLPQCGLLECFARFDHSTWQRHLTAMPVQRVGSDRQDDVRSGTNGKNQQESRRMPNARRIETVRPLAAWNRREHSLSLGARQLALKRGVELTDDVSEQHQTIFFRPRSVTSPCCD